MNNSQPKVLDLFCGCGGLSAGAQAAGFDVVAGLDFEPQYMCTFSHNFPNAESISADITLLSPKDLARTLHIKRGSLDLLVGGPPCQGFSKNVPRRRRMMEDPRNQLVMTFLEYCKYFRPRVVLMENVAEMKNGFAQAYTAEIIDTLHGAGYGVSHAVMNAADYGVPQRRRRAFFLAVLDGKAPQIPDPTHLERQTPADLFPIEHHVTVWEAIGDLPSLKHGEKADPCEYISAPASGFQAWARGLGTQVRNHVARRLQPLQYERLASLRPGQGLRDLPNHLKTRGGYSGAYGRLKKDMVAPTITRWVFHPGSGRWGHPSDTRTLSIREIARIQGFPDSFEFEGTFTQQAGQLGNAVPPLLAKRIVEAVKSQVLL